MVHMVSLPSIHEGFPDLDFKDPPPPGSYPMSRPQSIPDHRSDRPNLQIPQSHGRSRRSSYSSPKPYDRHADYPPPTRRRSSSFVGHHPDSEDRYRDSVTSSSRYLPHPSPRGTHPTPSSLISLPSPIFPPPPEYVGPTAANVSSRLPTNSSPNGTHSFDVLRSDPGTISLEHIASSKTLQNRGAAGIKPASPTGIANGSSPAFRVTLTDPPSGRYEAADAPLEVMGRRSSRTFPVTASHGPSERQLGPVRSNDTSDYPSLVAFSMSDGSSVSKLTVDGNGRSHFEEVGNGSFRLDGRGKKHQCPQCSKRFNRPSSLRIHVNTHTGARPFQCPYPNCGREFNVNSNMRRHYRNHSIPATDEVHPPRHNSGRRPHGYSRPHPGRDSTSVFHVAGASRSVHSPGSSPTASDDDYDMEQGSAGDYDSGFDEDVAEHDDEDDRDHIRSNYPTWSRSPSPSPHHERPRGYAYTGASDPVHHSAYANSRHHPSSPATHYYSPPSPAYAQSYRGSDVSTTLRPAFR